MFRIDSTKSICLHTDIYRCCSSLHFQRLRAGGGSRAGLWGGGGHSCLFQVKSFLTLLLSFGVWPPQLPGSGPATSKRKVKECHHKSNRSIFKQPHSMIYSVSYQLVLLLLLKIFKEGWLFGCRCFSRGPPFKYIIQLRRNKISIKNLITTATKVSEELHTIMKL